MMSLLKLFKMANISFMRVNRISYTLRTCRKNDSKDEISVSPKKEKNKKSSISVDKIFSEKTEEKSENQIFVSISDDSEGSKSDKSQEDKLIILTTERGRDASVRSKLTKEYNRLLKKRIALTSSGLNLSVEIDKEKPSYDIPPVTIPKIKHDIEKVPYMPEFDIKIEREPTVERPVRQEPGKVILGVIPEEWLHFFLPKTGVTGFYTFVFTFGTFLVSKEIYVLEHNFYNGLGMLVICWSAVKYIGPHIALYLDGEIYDYEEAWKQSRETEKNQIVHAIEDESWSQYQMEGNILLMDAKRENIALQLEDEYRKRQMHVYNEVKRYLDYQVEIAQVYKKIFHKNLLDYVFREVSKAVTPDMQDKILNYSIDKLVMKLKKEDEKK